MQIGILRDNDNQMQNFPAFAYSPSSEAYMYTSPNAGPDFSGLFSVARNVYERQVATHFTFIAACFCQAYF